MSSLIERGRPAQADQDSEDAPERAVRITIRAGLRRWKQRLAVTESARCRKRDGARRYPKRDACQCRPPSLVVHTVAPSVLTARATSVDSKPRNRTDPRPGTRAQLRPPSALR